MAIADITLLSGFSALRADLEKVRSAARGGWGGPCAPGSPAPSPKLSQPQNAVSCRAPGHLPVTICLSPQLASLSDRYVSHFETEGPHVLLYFDSVSRERGHGEGRPWVY